MPGTAATLLDTSALIEFLRGNERVREVIGAGNCYICVTTFAELANYAMRVGTEIATITERVEKICTTIYVDKGISEFAGRLNFERKKINKDWGMMDSFVLAASRLYGFRILTKDMDFKDLENVEMI